MSPLISSFDGMRVRMNELDHEPTHLHVIYQGREELEEPAQTRWNRQGFPAIVEMRHDMSEEYIPQIYMVNPVGGKVVDCYFTNGAIRRYDVSAAIRQGGVFAPITDQKVFEKSLTVMDGVLAFDVTGKRDPYDMIDICADVVYADGEPVSGRARTPSAPPSEKGAAA